jgi:thiamine biosynthesis lipoprotein
MGTVLEITLCAPSISQHQQLSEALFSTATRLNTLLTTFSPDSSVSRLNARAGHGPQPVPPEVADILALSLRYGRLTGGTFDVTIGPLMTLWRQAAATQELPSATVLRRIHARVGSRHIRLLNGTVSLPQEGMAIDLGGIGKGYALDVLVRQLRTQKVHSALFDFGQSSMWALGTPPGAKGWRLLLQQPNGGIVGTLTLHDQALSVSASLGQIFEISGQRYGHVIDPRTGEPLQRDLLACVIAPSATQAEALSKALLVLGEREGIALLQRFPGVEGLLVEGDGQRWLTTGWEQTVSFAPL